MLKIKKLVRNYIFKTHLPEAAHYGAKHTRTKVASPHHIVRRREVNWIFAAEEQSEKIQMTAAWDSQNGCVSRKGGRAIAITMASVKKCVNKKF